MIKPYGAVVPISQAETVPTVDNGVSVLLGWEQSTVEFFGGGESVVFLRHPAFRSCVLDGTRAAETVVMLRTKLSLSRILPGLAACCALAVSNSAIGAPPHDPRLAEPDYEASGFVVPAGYSAPLPQNPNNVIQAGAPYGQIPSYPVAQTSFLGGNCDSGECEMSGGCGCSDCCGASGIGHGGLLANLHATGDCGECGMSSWRNLCLFCQGNGCGVCQSIGRGHVLGFLGALGPYTEAGIGAQRWYDVSAEALFLSLDTDAGNMPLTSDGINGPIVLNAGDAFNNDLQAGLRLSAAIVCGVGGNVELTYMGTSDFGGSAGVSRTNPVLYSYLSGFGTAPPGGFDDTDAALFQGIRSTSRFHSGEVNYRRRWVGPYSRFQGSWLAGVRYVDFDDKLVYRSQGLNNDTVAADDLRFFEARFKTANSMTGFQLGGDLWWNLYPGINLGMGLKGAALGNVSKLNGSIDSNSIGPAGVAFPLGFSASDKNSDTAWLTEFDATAIYRFSYSWSFRSSYYLININDVALGMNALETSSLTALGGGGVAATLAPINSSSDITLQGMSFGLEYLW